jgi:hypothetical protein
VPGIGAGGGGAAGGGDGTNIGGNGLQHLRVAGGDRGWWFARMSHTTIGGTTGAGANATATPSQLANAYGYWDVPRMPGMEGMGGGGGAGEQDNHQPRASSNGGNGATGQVGIVVMERLC